MFSSITQGSRRARGEVPRMRGLLALVFAAAAVAVFAPASPADASTPAIPVNAWITIANNWTHQCLYASILPPQATAVTQQPCGSSGTGALFKLTETRFVGITQLYELRTYNEPSECLDLPNYGGEPSGTVVGVYACSPAPGLDNQEWSVSQVSSDSNGPVYKLQNYASSDYCLDVSGWASNGSDEKSGLKPTIYPCHNSSWANGGWDDHLWYLGVG